ncbi:MAG: transcription termination/antitermination protein NusG [Microgenomates group bacterium]
MNYSIGQTFPATEPPRGITHGPDMPPTWFCLIVPAQKESAARAYFKAKGIYAFYPSRLHARTVRGKRTEIERPIISGHLYAQFRQAAQWDVLKARRIIRGIYCRGVTPVAIPPEVIKHLQGLTVEAERLEAERAEMMRVREGDRAVIVTGALAGLCVDVGQIRGDEAWLRLPIGGRIKASLKSLERAP